MTQTKHFPPGPVFTFLLLACSSVLGLSPALAAPWEVESPNHKVLLSVHLGKPTNPNNPDDKLRLYYQIEHGLPDARTVVVAESPMGLVLQGQDFVENLVCQPPEESGQIEERYTMPHGKRRERHNAANTLTLRFRNAADQPFELELRAYNDGAAFRYVLPGPATEKQTLHSEVTGFAFPEGARLWMQPHDDPGAYETFYENGVPAGAPPETKTGWSLPALFRTADEKHWGLIADAAVGPDNCGIHLGNAAPDGLYTVGLPDPGEGLGYGQPQPTFQLPWKSAWRTIVLGDSPGAIVESTLVDDLNPPTELINTSWIRPGRLAWSWYADPPSPRDATKQKQFVDLAADMGWEYILVDANWDIMEKGNVQDVIRYAKDKGVGVLLWYNSGGPINEVTERPRDRLFDAKIRQRELETLNQWGVKGMKVDFFGSDKPEVMALYLDILKDAADAKVMISFHGCTIPKGWSRTYPNLMTMEGVRGEETYLFHKGFPDIAPVQNTILPFTRNAVGPMDYTLVALTPKAIAHKTTYAHELALAVLFESGWLCFADSPEVYRRLPDGPKQFLKDVPAAWDDTRFVAGYPGRDVVLARRHGDSWYVAGVNGRNEPQQQALDLKSILPEGTFHMTLIADGPDAKQFKTETRDVTAKDSIKIPLLPYGGFAAQFKPANKP